jgi:hypothetical protein
MNVVRVMKYNLFIVVVVLLLKMTLEVEGLPSVEEIQARVNKRYDELFLKDTNGKLVPAVCCLCDEFLMTKDDFCILPPKKLIAMKKVSLGKVWTKVIVLKPLRMSIVLRMKAD